MKRFILTFIAIVFVFLCIPLNSLAIESGTCGEGVTWTFENGELRISGNGAISDYNTWDNLAPWNKKGLEKTTNKIIIDEGITEIGEYAFLASRAESIIIPEGVTRIGTGALDFIRMREIHFPSSLTLLSRASLRGTFHKITVGENNPEYYVDGNCLIEKSTKKLVALFGDLFGKGAHTLEIPNDGSIEIIAEDFWCTSNRTTVQIPETVTTIEDFAFCGQEVVAITIPESVTTVGKWAFAYNDLLSDIYCRAESKPEGWSDGWLENTNARVHWGYDGPTIIDAGFANKRLWRMDDEGNIIFYGNCNEQYIVPPPSSLAGLNVIIGEDVTNILEREFYDEEIFELTIPEGVTSIGNSAFGHSSLKAITIPKTVTDISDRAFEALDLFDIVIPDSVVNMGSSVFNWNRFLTEIYCEAESKPEGWSDDWLGDCEATVHWGYDGSQNDGSIIASGDCGKNVKWSLTNAGKLTISGTGDMYSDFRISFDEETQEFILDERPWADYKDKIRDVVIEDGVTSISANAFRRIERIRSVDFGNTVMRIGSHSFTYNMGIRKLEIPDSVVDIEWSAFKDLFYLTDLTLGKSLKNIEREAFYGCYLQSLTLPNSLEVIGKEAFAFNSLTEVVLPESVKRIGYNCFDGNQFLVAIDKNNNEIVEELKYTEYENGLYLGSENNPYYALVAIADTSITELTMHPDTRVVADGIVNKCGGLKVLSLGDYVEYLHFDGVELATNLEKVYLGKSLKEIDGKLFRSCEKLETIDIPDTVEKIGEGAFQGCSALKKVNLGKSVKTIEMYAFGGCRSLTEINFPNSLTTIGAYAFSDCRSLAKVSIPSSVTTVERDAFPYETKVEHSFETLPEGWSDEWQSSEKDDDKSDRTTKGEVIKKLVILGTAIVGVAAVAVITVVVIKKLKKRRSSN